MKRLREAVALHGAGRSAEAAAMLEGALRLEPADPLAWNAYGAIQVDRGLLDLAEQALRKAVHLDAGYLEARYNLALLLRRKGLQDAAMQALDELLALQPGFAPAQLERATLQVERGEAALALPMLESLVERFPQDARALANTAAACRRLGQFERAAALCERAAASPQCTPALRATLAETCEALAVARLGAMQHPAAEKVLRLQLALSPASRTAPQNLAVALEGQGRLAEARQALEAALAAGHEDAELLCALVSYQARACDWAGLAPRVARLRGLALVASPHPADPQMSLYLEGVGANEQQTWARNFVAVRIPPREALPARPRAPGTRPRIAFLGGDFHDHPTSLLMAGMLERLDAGRFDYSIYSHGPDDGSAVRERVARATPRFNDVRDQASEAIARRIRDDGIDVLVDLGGHVKGSRLDVLAWRPARLQGHFLGYPGTTGAPFVDFFIADALTVPEGAERHFTERVLRMPACCQPNDAPGAPPDAPSRPSCGLPDDALVFCSFNQPVKITASVFGEWCRLLLAMPDSVLWLLDFDPQARGHLRDDAARLGLDAARLVFAPRVPQADHLARLALADIALDTFPCTSHTTASDLLRAGVPLVTVAGETFASRVAASVLHAAGRSEWVFEDRQAAFSFTVALGRDRARLSRERRKLREDAPGMALFDPDRFARDFEGLLAGLL